MNRIYQTICQYHMISPGDRVIAGVSGGADSVCLLRALAGYREQVPFTLFVVHVEHGIRGAESLADAGFCKGAVRSACSSLLYGSSGCNCVCKGASDDGGRGRAQCAL